MKKRMLAKWVAGGAIMLVSSTLHAVVTDDLLTNANGATPWQNCEGSTLVNEATNTFDENHLKNEGCAYRETVAKPDVRYKFSCGVSSLKYSSMTLAFLDANDSTLATKTTEILEDINGGAYSVVLQAPAGTVSAAVGIYGLAGSGFQSCTLLIDEPDPRPKDGSIAGVTWFDKDEDTLLAATESLIPSTPVSLLREGAVIAQATTGLNGEYYFGGLDLGACYSVLFAPADATLMFTGAGGDNDADANGSTANICLSEASPNVTDIDAGFAAVPPVEPPADYAVCGIAWLTNPDANEDTALSNIKVTLTDVVSGGQQMTMTGVNGSYTFDSLPAGDYKLQFASLAGHTFVAGDSSLTVGSSYAGTNGMTPQFNLPANGNTGADDACTISNANAGFNRTPVALEPTVANDDEVKGIVGENLMVDILTNDVPCNAQVQEVDLVGHNVPGDVAYDAATGKFMITNTTASGTYSIQYGLRGSCGSYDKADVAVIIEEAPPVVDPNAPPPIPLCFASIGKESSAESALHVDLFASAELPVSEFATAFNFYDANMNLKFTGLNAVAGRRSNFLFFRAREHGVDVLEFAYVTQLENGLESAPTACVTRNVTPVAIDIDNSGHVERVAGEFTFDITGNGTKESLSEWFAPTDGILIDKHFGKSISGEHLFGDVGGKYANGFAKLALQDLNNDGKLSGAELQDIALWTDRNSNAQVDEGEISSLESHSIESLSVEHYKYSARAVLGNGKTMLMRDLWFSTHPTIQASK